MSSTLSDLVKVDDEPIFVRKTCKPAYGNRDMQDQEIFDEVEAQQTVEEFLREHQEACDD